MAPPVPLKSKNTRSTGTGTSISTTPATARKGTTTATAPGKGSSSTAASAAASTTKGTSSTKGIGVGVGTTTATAGATITKKAASVPVNGPKKEAGLSTKAPASSTAKKNAASVPTPTPGGTKTKDKDQDVINGNEPPPPPPTLDSNANEVASTDSASPPPEEPILAPPPSALFLPVAEKGKKNEVATKKAKEKKPTEQCEQVGKVEPKITIKKSTTTSVASGSGPSATNKSAYVPPRSRSKGVATPAAAPPNAKTGSAGPGAVSKAAPVSTSAPTKSGGPSAPPKAEKQVNGSGAAAKTATATTLKKVVLKVPPPPPIGHPLHSTWTFWYQNTKHNTRWEDSFKQIHTFGMAESFWTLQEKVRGPSELGPGSSYYLFKNGIFPAWENEHNRSGGRWIVMTEARHRGWLDSVWLEVMMLLIGEGFGEDGDEICGAGLDVRGKGDKIAIWTGDYTKEDAILNIGRKIQNCLQAVPNFFPRQRMTYEVHEDPEPGVRSTHARERGGDKDQRCLHSLEFVGLFP